MLAYSDISIKEHEHLIALDSTFPEAFSTTLKLRTSNGINEARRDKFMMQCALADAGVPCIRQLLTDSWEDAHKFLLEVGEWLLLQHFN